MAEVTTESAIVAEVRRHYASSSKPYYLSSLGSFLSKSKLAIPTGMSLADFVKSALNSQVELVQDPKVPARVAVVIPELKAQVERQVFTLSAEVPGATSIDYRRLPFALLAAFCKQLEESQKLFIRAKPPFRYSVGATKPDEESVEIDRKYQPGDLVGKNAKSLTREEIQVVYAAIGEWAKSERIDLTSFYLDLPAGGRRAGASRSNALQRLIEAQDESIRADIRIPLDIAEALMKMR